MSIEVAWCIALLAISVIILATWCWDLTRRCRRAENMIEFLRLDLYTEPRDYFKVGVIRDE